MKADDRKKVERLILGVRRLAGQIGSMHHSLDDESDSANYDFQVKVGLANAVSAILDHDTQNLIHWIGYCLIACDVDADERVSALLDALAHEVNSQFDSDFSENSVAEGNEGS